jgi:hypothetical protein
MATHTPRPPATRLPALVLIGAGIAGALVMAFHPSAHGTGVEARLHGLAAISPLAMHVHMAMIACVVAVWLALAWIARQSPSGWVWLAARLYALGAAAMVGAALLYGFITGAYLGRALPAVATAMDALPPVLLAFSANQVLAGFGTLVMSAAIVAWSVALVRMPGRLARVCGVYGIGAGWACIVAYASGLLSLDVAGMMAVVVAHGAWYCLLGLWSLRGGQVAAGSRGFM